MIENSGSLPFAWVIFYMLINSLFFHLNKVKHYSPARIAGYNRWFFLPGPLNGERIIFIRSYISIILLNRERACCTPSGRRSSAAMAERRLLGVRGGGVFGGYVPRVAPWAIMLDAVGVLLILHSVYPHNMTENPFR